MTARKVDQNGYILIERNPISRSGVFPYLGSSIGAPEPDRVYNVYRPQEEIEDPECLESFKLLPIVDDHVFLGRSVEGLTPAEQKGVHGSTGETVEAEGGIMYSTLKIFSEAMADLIESGKKDLSLGYRCVYEKASGLFNGQRYDYIQRGMRGNHLALVDTARCGVSVLDQGITFDHLDLNPRKEPTMNDKNLKDQGKKNDGKTQDEMSLEAVLSELGKLSKVVEALQATAGKIETAVTATEGGGDEGKDPAKDEGKEADPEKKETATGADAAVVATLQKDIKTAMDGIAALTKSVEDLKKGSVKAVTGEIAQRDKLAESLAPHIGSFDHADKTLQEVAEYGVKKLELACDSGAELATLNGFLAGAKKATPSKSVAMDSGKKSDIVLNHIAGKKQ